MIYLSRRFQMKHRMPLRFSFDTASNLILRHGQASRPPWTCKSCLQHRQFQRPLIRGQKASYATQSAQVGYENAAGSGSKRSRKTALYAATGGTLAIVGFTFSDDVKHAYAAARRTGRVVATLAVCINE